jgi:hypothetical protein
MLTWTTPSNLGSRSEGTALSIQLTAISSRGGTIRYGLVAGSLPTGTSLTSLGLLTGIPIGNFSFKFVVRASNTVAGNTIVSDRTFSVLVVGNAPVVGTVITLPDQNDIVYYAYQVVATDVDLQDILTYKISSGYLPNALTLSRTGLISGFITNQPAGRFEFTVAVSDSSYTVYQSFVLNIKNRNSTEIVVPLILNLNSYIGTFRVQDQFSYKIDGSLDGVTPSTVLTYAIVSGSLPPGLTLRNNTGWIDGFLSSSDYVSLNNVTYTFTVVARNGSTSSIPKTFTITINPVAISTGTVIWPVDSVLGTVKLGGVSKFDINPHNTNRVTSFRIKSGTIGILPPNLTLQSNGLIVGRVSFLEPRSVASSTLIGTYTFVTEMVDTNGIVIAEKQFTINTEYQYPYETVYLKAFPRQTQRNLLFNFLYDVKIVPRDYVYRLGDANFGIASEFKMLALTGLKIKTGNAYVAAMVKHHSRKVAYMKEFKLAVARDSVTSLPIYEVVYGVLYDTKQDAPNTIVLQKFSRPDLKVNSSKINASYASIIGADQSTVVDVYPNSFDNMRNSVGTGVEFETRYVLPEWLITLQEDGTTLNYANVVPLVYTQVGRGAAVLANITATGESFDTIPFDVDGYVWEDYVQPSSITGNEIATSGITTKYLAFPRTGVTEYNR